MNGLRLSAIKQQICVWGEVGETNIPIPIAQKCDGDAGLQKLLDKIGHGRTAERIFRIKD